MYESYLLLFVVFLLCPFSCFLHLCGDLFSLMSTDFLDNFFLLLFIAPSLMNASVPLMAYAIGNANVVGGLEPKDVV